MKIFLPLLLILLAALQYKLWFADDGLIQTYKLKQIAKIQEQKNDELKTKNESIAAEIKSLKKGSTAIENIARKDLGMIKKGEVFYQIVK